jgi:hypothetical protein
MDKRSVISSYSDPLPERVRIAIRLQCDVPRHELLAACLTEIGTVYVDTTLDAARLEACATATSLGGNCDRGTGGKRVTLRQAS